MRPHPRIRTAIKWGGAAVTVLLVVVWIGSRWYHIIAIGGNKRGIVVTWGLIEYLEPNGKQERPLPELSIGRTPAPLMYWSPGVAAALYNQVYQLPLWIPSLAAALVTARAWRLDILARRRARVGLCPKCHYDRTGLGLSAKCPECGADPAAR